MRRKVIGEQPVRKLPEFGAETPLGRAGQPVELSPLYVLLASNESSSRRVRCSRLSAD